MFGLVGFWRLDAKVGSEGFSGAKLGCEGPLSPKSACTSFATAASCEAFVATLSGMLLLLLLLRWGLSTGGMGVGRVAEASEGEVGGLGRCIAGTLEGRRGGEGATTAVRPFELLVAVVAACTDSSDPFPGAATDPFEVPLLAALDVVSLLLVLTSAEVACCSVLSWTATGGAGGATGRATKLGAGLSSLFLADFGALSSRNPLGGANRLTSGACAAADVAWREGFGAAG